ncbi:MAG: efflux RND transporter periplasmic adaptor subunit [Methylophilus sp.]
MNFKCRTKQQIRATMKPIYLTLLLTMFHTFSHAEVIQLTPAQIKNMQIELAKVSTNSAMQSIRYSAEVVLPANQERIITAPQQGLIDVLNVSIGEEVKKGQVIAHLISTDLVSIQSDYLQTFTKKNLAASALKRDTELFKDGIIAQRRYLETQSTFEELSAALAEKKQTLMMSGMSEQAIKNLGASKKMNSGISIVAPISGQVVEQMASVGQRIDMATPIYKIAQLNTLWLEINVPIEQALALKNGMRVDVPKQQAHGTITAILRSLNKNNQTMHVRAEIKQGAERLALGQFVETEILTGAKENQFTIPRTALARNGQASFIFKQVKTGFESVPVKLISEQGTQAVVEAPLKDNEMIAISGIAALKGSWLGLGGE